MHAPLKIHSTIGALAVLAAPIFHAADLPDPDGKPADMDRYNAALSIFSFKPRVTTCSRLIARLAGSFPTDVSKGPGLRHPNCPTDGSQELDF